MRNKILLFTLTIFGLTIGPQFITSCKKYPDGPEFSLRTRKERLANTWKVDNYKINGTDFTSLLAN